MPVEFDLVLNDQQNTNNRMSVKVRLEEDHTWHFANPPNGDRNGVYHLPNSGTWHVVEATPLPKGVGLTAIFRGTLVLNVANLVGVAVFMGEFFPATVNKQGRGTATGGRDGALPTSSVNWRISLAENMLAGDFSTKFRQAVELAKPQIIAKLGPAAFKQLTDPLFITILATNFIKNPAMWFKVLRAVGLKVLAIFYIIQLVARLNAIMSAIDAAQTQQELQQSGNALADLLADLAAQIGIMIFLEAIRASRGSKEEDQRSGKNAPAPSDPPTNYRSWRDGARDLQNRINDIIRNIDNRPADQIMADLERMSGLRVQLIWWRTFIIETAHHVEWVRRSAGEIMKTAKNVRSIISSAGNKEAGYEAALKWLLGEFKKSGISVQEAAEKQMIEVIRALDICGDLDWSWHDLESWLTTKFNEAVSKGLKNPFNFRELPALKGWTLEMYEKAAQGLDPRPGHEGRKMTESDVLDLFGPKAKEFLKVFGSPEEVFQGLVDAEIAYRQHNTNDPNAGGTGRIAPGHHQPSAGLKKLPDTYRGQGLPPGPQPKGKFDFTNWSNNALYYSAMLEKGADTVHAMLQVRLYRLFFGKKPMSMGEIAQSPEGKNPFTVFGLLIFSRFKMFDVINPCRVSDETLKGLGIPDLLQDARNMATQKPPQ